MCVILFLMFESEYDQVSIFITYNYTFHDVMFSDVGITIDLIKNWVCIKMSVFLNFFFIFLDY